MGDIDNYHSGGHSNIICLSGIGNTLGNAIRTAKPDSQDYMSFVTGQGNSVNYENESTRPPQNVIKNVNTNSIMIVGGFSNTITNYDMKADDSEGTNSIIIAAGKFHTVKNRFKNSIVVSTGQGTGNEDKESYKTLFDSSIYLSAGQADLSEGNIKSFIILDPQSIPSFNYISADTFLCYNSSDGRIGNRAMSDFTIPSSRKFKKNITEITHEDSIAIDSLNPVIFNYISSIKKGRKAAGLLAEDLLGTPFEFAIIYDNNGNIESIDYNSIFILLLSSYKETIKKQEQRITLLEEKYQEIDQLKLLINP